MFGDRGKALVRALLGATLVAWTVIWAVPAVQALMETSLFQAGAEGVAGWQVLEILFVEAYYGVRWLPGLVLFIVAWVVTGRVMAPRPATASSN